MTSVTAWNPPPDSDDEDQQSERFQDSFSRESVLAIIDVSMHMFRPWNDTDTTPFKAAIKCCHSLWRSKIISNPKDVVGILCMGSENMNNSSDFPNLYVLQEMSSVTVNKIVELDKIVASDECDGFCDKVGSSSVYSLKDTFWLATILFEDAKTTSFSKKIIFFTCEDNPHAGEPNLQNDAINKFKDLGNVQFNIVTFKQDFDYDKFYKNILDSPASVDIPQDLDSLVKVVRMRRRLKRPVTRSTLEIAPGIKIGVGTYSLIRRALPPKAVKINKRNNEVVTKTTNKFRADTGATILKSDQVSVVQLQGEQVVFSREELKVSNYSHEPGMKLLAFLDQSEVDPFAWFHSDGYFLYPDEDRWNGSRDLYVALLRRCHELQKVALVKMVVSRGRTPRLALLIPSLGEGIGRNQKLPDGFQLFKLPFSDEIRQVPFEWTSDVDPPAEIVGLMEKIIKKITNRNFDVLAVQNPTLQHKWREIESAVLDDDDMSISTDKFEDYTVPNNQAMGDRIGNLCRDFMENTAVLTNSFRGSSSTAAKKPKVNVNMAMEAKNRRVEKLTCAVLSEFLESVGIPTYRKVKAALVEEVYNYFNM